MINNSVKTKATHRDKIEAALKQWLRKQQKPPTQQKKIKISVYPETEKSKQQYKVFKSKYRPQTEEIQLTQEAKFKTLKIEKQDNKEMVVPNWD